ncbi:hypothetical protein [Mesorhizobium waimense]|uniref:hypothetical protein n=1 Tax=Mesorhizobium waimense TaxID=1300307 RepID=UPI00142E0416|nr:hypothetical protein [Mesorhizobium waimense]
MAEPHANLDARRRLRHLQWVDVEPWKRGSGRGLLEDHGQTTRRGHFNNQFFDRLIGKSRLCYVPDMFDKTVDRYSHGVRGVIEKTTDFNHNVGIYVAWQISHTSSPTYRNIAAFLSIVESSRRKRRAVRWAELLPSRPGFLNLPVALAGTAFGFWLVKA